MKVIKNKLDIIQKEVEETDPCILEFLKIVHREFPLNKAKMGKDFKGTHSLTLSPNDKVQLNIWWNGKSWSTICD